MLMLTPVRFGATAVLTKPGDVITPVDSTVHGQIAPPIIQGGKPWAAVLKDTYAQITAWLEQAFSTDSAKDKLQDAQSVQPKLPPEVIAMAERFESAEIDLNEFRQRFGFEPTPKELVAINAQFPELQLQESDLSPLGMLLDTLPGGLLLQPDDWKEFCKLFKLSDALASDDSSESNPLALLSEKSRTAIITAGRHFKATQEQSITYSDAWKYVYELEYMRHLGQYTELTPYNRGGLLDPFKRGNHFLFRAPIHWTRLQYQAFSHHISRTNRFLTRPSVSNSIKGSEIANAEISARAAARHSSVGYVWLNNGDRIKLSQIANLRAYPDALWQTIGRIKYSPLTQARNDLKAEFESIQDVNEKFQMLVKKYNSGSSDVGPQEMRSAVNDWLKAQSDFNRVVMALFATIPSQEELNAMDPVSGKELIVRFSTKLPKGMDPATSTRKAFQEAAHLASEARYDKREIVMALRLPDDDPLETTSWMDAMVRSAKAIDWLYADRIGSKLHELKQRRHEQRSLVFAT